MSEEERGNQRSWRSPQISRLALRIVQLKTTADPYRKQCTVSDITQYRISAPMVSGVLRQHPSLECEPRAANPETREFIVFSLGLIRAF